MLWGSEEVQETLRMIGAEHLDIRTVTMGISLLGCQEGGREGCIGRIEEKIVSLASRLVEVTREIEDMYGVPIVNRRVSVTPISLVFSGSCTGDFVEAALALERAAKRVGVDYLGGFSALVHKGATRNESALIEAIPEVLKNTTRVCSSVNLATTRAGINMDAVKLMGSKIKETAFATEHGSGCARLVVFANAVEDNPFIAGAFHGPGEDECVVNIGVSGPGAVLSAIERLKRHTKDINLAILAETIKRTAFKITRAGELVGREVVKRLGEPVKFGIVDLSLAPTPAVGDSVANILEAMGLEKAGAHGTTAALAMLVDAVKKGGVMASSSVGGLSGAFIPVSEDSGMVNAVKAGAMTIEKLEAMTSVCSVGLDMVAIPGDTPVETISAIIADEMAIGVINNKTTAARIIPVPGKHAGDSVDLGGLLGELIVMDVRNFDSSGFVNYGGQIPAPVQSLRN